MSKNDFFAVGRPKSPPVNIDLEENKNWKEIRPNQANDALLKNAFKKRKYDEFKEKKAKFAAMPGKPVPSSETGRILPFTSNKPTKRFKSNKEETQYRQTSALSDQYKRNKQISKENLQKKKELTEQELKAQQAQTFIKEIEKILGEEDNAKFREAFKQYKTSIHPVIDEFAKDLFGVMFGDREHAVCHLEVTKYVQKKMIICKLRE